MIFLVFFFFSSRRRHTRFDCDWSSDVCSSDLTAFPTHSTTGASTCLNSAQCSSRTYWMPAVCERSPWWDVRWAASLRSEEHTSELQSQSNLVCRLLLEKKKHNHRHHWIAWRLV